ncbi:ferritin family protein [Clostridium ganghwense]|uniref:Rubrerythrin n=1 Tax=Clostridium ganghwense TaxID=312089 RepID=A0ABT4CLV5_9CLOT|nr:ferritin family protein [Clostridium ganghwense]MCY6370022.1 rubrerythrin [Clostridium ganghwense]
MSYTTDRQPQGLPYCFTNKLREAMIAELIAINDYAYHISRSDIKDINEVLYHIMEDEKRHYGMFLKLLRKYDPVQYSRYIEAKEHVELNKNAKHINIREKHSEDSLLNFIRLDIKGELEAIILYEQHLIEIPHKDIKQTFIDVIADEKEHVEELTLVLMHYDKDKYGPIE